MTSRQSVWIIALVGVAALAGLFLVLKPSADAPAAIASADCAPIDIVVDKGNSVHGLKNGNLFAYVDLAGMAPGLFCHSDADIQKAVTDAVSQNVAVWWKEPRLASATRAEVHVISILDKDEYARASFNSARVHGKIEFIRDGERIEALPTSLTFDNMRTAKP